MIDGRALATVASIVVTCAGGVAVAQRPVDAGGEPPPRVELQLPKCAQTGIDFEEVVRLLRIELRGDGVEELVLADDGPEAGPVGKGLATVRLQLPRCAPDAATVTVIVDDMLTHKRVQRVLDLSESTPNARARALALGVAELLRASWAELSRGSPQPGEGIPAAVRRAITVSLAGVPEAASLARTGSEETPTALGEPAVGTPPLDADGVEEPVRDPSWELAATGSFRSFPNDGSSLLGGRLAAWWLLGSRISVRLGLDAGAAIGDVDVQVSDPGTDDPLKSGNVDLGLATGGLALLVGSGEDDGFALGVGPHVEVGYGWADSQSSELVVLEGGGTAVVVTSVQARIRALLTDVWSAVATLELGYAVRGLDATTGDVTPTGLGGVTASIYLGIAAAPDAR